MHGNQSDLSGGKCNIICCEMCERVIYHNYVFIFEIKLLFSFSPLREENDKFVFNLETWGSL